MKILLASSEMAPFAKTGGLGDVAGALPKALAALGHEVAVALPFYGSVDREKLGAQCILPEIVVDLPAGQRTLAVWKATMPPETEDASPVTIFLIEDPALYDRPQLYVEDGREYPDNCLRFAYYCMTLLWSLKPLDWVPDVIHCNDWQTAFIPLFMRHNPWISQDEALAHIPVLFSIHNLAYQGVYADYLLEQLGLPRSAYNSEELEFYGNLCLMKGALVYSDAISTVSRQYAKEIQTHEFGCGLEGVLRRYKDKTCGILNGIDTAIWNPETDPHLPANFTASNLKGKATCKAHLQKQFGLTVKANVPLMGIVTRLSDQKGLDLLAEVLPEVLKDNVQLVVLGTGEARYHEFFTQLAEDFPQKVGVELSFNDPLAHQIEAGCDLFLMPSRYEPCGLNQMYSLRYGTVPVVRRTGGLADSITNTTPASIKSGNATGFVFTPYESRYLLATIERALNLYRSNKTVWRQIVKRSMNEDFSWARSAKAYERLMKKMLSQA